MKTIEHDQWLRKGEELFGKDVKKWQFVCPGCKTVQTIQDFIDAEVSKETISRSIGFSCIGRFTDKKGCKWTLGGLLRIHKLEVVQNGKAIPSFEFANGE